MVAHQAGREPLIKISPAVVDLAADLQEGQGVPPRACPHSESAWGDVQVACRIRAGEEVGQWRGVFGHVRESAQGTRYPRRYPSLAGRSKAKTQGRREKLGRKRVATCDLGMVQGARNDAGTHVVRLDQSRSGR